MGVGCQLCRTTCWPQAPLGGGGGGLGRDGSGWGDQGGGLGGLLPVGGGVQQGRFGRGGSRWGDLRVHEPKAKRWSITGSPYLPLPSLQPYHHPHQD